MSSLPVNHISAYHLTYHGGTLFYRWLKSKKISETTEEESISQFKLLIDKCSEMGFEQYEISNFARDGAYSKHNSSYWSGKKYLGLGPSAHSYNILSRQKNISTVEKYINSVEKGELFFKTEKLNANSKYNEFILTRLRTKWGISVDELKRRLGEKYFLHFVRKAEKFIVSGNLILNNGVYTFSLQGQFISDNVITDLMIV
jgi:oxygen-independent coproporphyrinogen-3 oxidase